MMKINNKNHHFFAKMVEENNKSFDKIHPFLLNRLALSLAVHIQVLL